MIRRSALVLALALFGCQCPAQPKSTGDAGPNDMDAGDMDAGTMDAGTDAGICPPPGSYDAGTVALSGPSVTAKIVDETGAPVENQPAYVCGVNICSNPAMTDSMGNVMVTTNLTETVPAFKVGDTIDYAELAIPLSMTTTDFTGGGSQVLTTGKLLGKPGAALTPGTTATSGDVSLTLAADAQVSIDTLIYDTSDRQKFRSVSIPLTNDAQVLAASGVSGFELFYGVAPSTTIICPPAQVTVALPHTTMEPNDFGWVAGTSVEFWGTTTDTGSTFAPYAGWAKISDGVVGSDGTTVTTTQGFYYLDNFAIRKAD